MDNLFESVYIDLVNNTFNLTKYLLETDLSFTNSSVKIDDKDNLLKTDDKLVSTINNNYNVVYNKGLKYLNDLIDDWYKESDGTYLFGINNINKLKKYMKLQYIRISKYYKLNIIDVNIWFNDSYHPKEFFGGHSFSISFSINDKYKVVGEPEFTIEG